MHLVVVLWTRNNILTHIEHLIQAYHYNRLWFVKKNFQWHLGENSGIASSQDHSYPVILSYHPYLLSVDFNTTSRSHDFHTSSKSITLANTVSALLFLQ